MSDGISSSLSNSVSPVMAIVSRASDKVIQVIGITAADVGSLASTYLGPDGPTMDINQASKINGTDGAVSASAVGTVTLAESSLTTLALSIRKITVAVSGVTTGSNYTAFPVSGTPAGYALADVYCGTNGQLTFSISVPVLTLGSYSFQVRVVKIL